MMLRRAGCLPVEDELPGESYRTNILWTQLARALDFRLVASFARRPADHINLKEVESCLVLEESLAASVWESSRSLCLMDSQVGLGALIKGRSSSSSLNLRLRASIPAVLFFNMFPQFAFVASEDNPSDDPSRFLPVRRPRLAEPDWLRDGELGDFSSLDLFLGKHGLMPEQREGLESLNSSFVARSGRTLACREASESFAAPREPRPEPTGSIPSVVSSAGQVDTSTNFAKRCSAKQFLWPGGRAP